MQRRLSEGLFQGEASVLMKKRTDTLTANRRRSIWAVMTGEEKDDKKNRPFCHLPLRECCGYLIIENVQRRNHHLFFSMNLSE